MEIRASYLLVGAVVLTLLAGLAAFSIWLVKADGDRQVARYEIAFEGSVSGLQEGSQVLYRGIPVGRVAAIRIDPANVENVLVTAEIDRHTPIKVDTVATLEMQGLTGLAHVQLRGGTQGSVRLDPDATPPPRIASRRSALERVFESGPELLASGLALAERLGRLLEDDNLEAVAGTLRNLETFTTTLAERSDQVDVVLAGAGDAAQQVEAVATDLQQLVGDLRRLTAHIDERVGVMGGDVTDTLGELRSAAATLGGAADRLDGLIGHLHEPLDDFAGTGLYDFTQLVGETRQLVAALSRITKEFERDPAGFLIGRSNRGYEAE
jgi:phospholipid/cholesterol/gamma-HCH transport system substrate-binding protein